MSAGSSTPTPVQEEPVPSRKGSYRGAFGIVVAAALIAVIAAHARTGVEGSARVGHPTNERTRPVEFLFGWDWIPFLHWATLVAVIGVVVLFVVKWRQQPRNPTLIMALMTTVIVWQDPIMNWAPYAVYNPDLWHWPEDWPLVSISPTVEPFVVIGYVMFYLGPYFPSIWLLRKLQSTRGPESFVWRHPLWSLAGIILPVGFVIDAMLEISLTSMGMYSYSQVIPWGSVFTGQYNQFPLIWESVFVTWVMIPAGVLLYRDDTGRTVGEKLAQKAKIFPRKPFWGMFVVMFLVINFSYFCYGWSFQIIRASGIATSVACPWPFPEAKVYDPQGHYAKAGAPGPYSEGRWNTWMSGQPGGRPDTPTAPTGPCAPGGNR